MKEIEQELLHPTGKLAPLMRARGFDEADVAELAALVADLAAETEEHHAN